MPNETREILFRGKRANNKKWVEGGIIPLDTDSGYVFIAEPFLSASSLPVYEIIKLHTHLVIPETVGQYTGLTDKNGKKIFEGDIVTGLFLFELSVNAVITFQDGAFGLEWHRGKAKTFNAFTSICNVEYEVIGNIHDNPELLKGE